MSAADKQQVTGMDYQARVPCPRCSRSRSPLPSENEGPDHMETCVVWAGPCRHLLHKGCRLRLSHAAHAWLYCRKRTRHPHTVLKPAQCQMQGHNHSNWVVHLTIHSASSAARSQQLAIPSPLCWLRVACCGRCGSTRAFVLRFEAKHTRVPTH